VREWIVKKITHLFLINSKCSSTSWWREQKVTGKWKEEFKWNWLNEIFNSCFTRTVVGTFAQNNKIFSKTRENSVPVSSILLLVLRNDSRSAYAYKIARTTSFLVCVLSVSSVFDKVVCSCRFDTRKFFNALHSLYTSYLAPLPRLLYHSWSLGFSCGLYICMCAEALGASNTLLLSNKESKGNVPKVEDAHQ